MIQRGEKGRVFQTLRAAVPADELISPVKTLVKKKKFEEELSDEGLVKELPARTNI